MANRGGYVMPYELLKRLCSAQLPGKIEDPAGIDKLQVLRTAQLIEVDMPLAQPEREGHCHGGNAIVMQVAPEGRAAARRSTRALPGGVVVRVARRSGVPSPFL